MRKVRALAGVVLLTVLVAGCDEQILHDLSEQDANKVLSRLSAGSVGAKKVLQSDGRWAISVSRDSIVPALSYLDTNRVLSPRSNAATSGSKGGFVPSREEQWFRYERSVALSIEDSLGAMLGVLEARVHLNLPETDPLFGTRKESTGSGSVLLVVDARYAAKDEEIAALVSGAAGIPATKVTVLKSQAQMAGLGSGAGVQVASQEPAMVPLKSHDVSTEQVASLVPREIGIASAAVVAFMGVGIFVFRSRRRKVTFSLPTGTESED
jgi:type III secretion protein J